MRTYDDIRLDCRACGIDLLQGEWLFGVCRTCDKAVRGLINESKVWGERWGGLTVFQRRPE